jgi:FlaA1/EpsC-like NDP-sugar epimerase
MINDILGRSSSIFHSDFETHKEELISKLSSASVVVVGGAGTIGSSVVKVLISLGVMKIQVIDISENNLVELIRDIRSSSTNYVSEIETYVLDCGSQEFEKFLMAQPKVDYLMNFSALKHVRSERDVYTMKRLVDVNIINSINLLRLAEIKKCKKYFCVSTDKAANPVNVMGASKLLMEKFMFSRVSDVEISTARFANVAFSDGSLLFGFEHRLKKNQPLAIPTDIRRFFVSPEEAGQLCVVSCLIAKNKQILFPKTNDLFKDVSLFEMAEKYLKFKGFKPQIFDDEFLARNAVEECSKKRNWPCYCFASETTGEKPFEEFYTENESVCLKSFKDIGVVDFKPDLESDDYDTFSKLYETFKEKGEWKKIDLVTLMQKFLPNFLHEEKNIYLDQKM